MLELDRIELELDAIESIRKLLEYIDAGAIGPRPFLQNVEDVIGRRLLLLKNGKTKGE